jgi:hypothetical protein
MGPAQRRVTRVGSIRTVQILYVYSRPYPFVQIDLELLRERWDVREWAQPGRYGNPLRVAGSKRARHWRRA